MGTPTTAPNNNAGVLRSAVWLGVCVTVLALLLLPLAADKTGSGSPWGLLVAAGICLLSSLASETIAYAVDRPEFPNSALASLVLGMGARLLPPLAICCYLALQGQSGREHLAFVVYLLAFYLVTLAVDTALAVRRLAGRATNLESSLSPNN